MTGRIPPDALDPMDSADDDGLYLVQKSGGRFREWYRLTVTGYVDLNLDDTAHAAELSVTALPPGEVPLTTEINGVPYFVWDDDNNLVMTEAP